MAKALTAIAALTVTVAAAWSGFWFYGKGKIVEEIEMQAQVLRDQGGEVSYDSIDISGFPFAYEGRIISPKITMASEELGHAWSAPWIEAKATATAPNVVEFTVADTQNVVLDLPEEDGGPLPIAVTSSDLKVISERGDDELLFRGGATSIGGSFSRTLEKAGMADVTFTIRDLTMSGRAKEGDGDQPRIALEYALARIEGTTQVEGNEDSSGGRITFSSGEIAGKADSLGDETIGSATLDDLGMTFKVAQLGDTLVDLGVGKVTVDTRIPSGADPAPQNFGYRIGIQDIAMAELLWAMIDPAKAFPREVNKLAIDVDGTAIFTANPSNAEAFAEAMASGMPIDVQTLRLNDLTVDALGLVAKGQGEGMIENDIPEGKATIGIDGFSGFMESMVKSGRIPPQQAMVVQLMVENFGKMSEGSETIRFDFEARDGMMYVNSLPIGEAPALPQQ